jgi:uncharacterized protein (DUF983 family)
VRLAPLTRGLRKRCPNCGAGDLFTSFFTIRSRCPECHVVFEREEGYWLGAMIVAIGVTEALFGIWFVAGMLLTWPDVPWTMLLIGGLVLNATIPVISYPWSKTTWMGLHHAFVPRTPSRRPTPPPPATRRRAMDVRRQAWTRTELQSAATRTILVVTGRSEGAEVPERAAGRHLRPVLRPTRFAVWWWLTVAAGTAVVLDALSAGTPLAAVEAGAGFWVLLVFMLLGELRPVVASGRTDPNGVILATAFHFAVLLHWGLELALIGVVVSALFGDLFRRKALFAGIFNASQYVLSYAAAWGVLQLLGWETTVQPAAQLGPGALLTIALAAVTYHLVNITIVGIAVGLTRGRSVTGAIFEDFVYYASTTGAVIALSPLVVVVLEPPLGVPAAAAVPALPALPDRRDVPRARAAGPPRRPDGIGNRALLARTPRGARRGRAAGRGLSARPRPVQGGQRHPRARHG